MKYMENNIMPENVFNRAMIDSDPSLLRMDIEELYNYLASAYDRYTSDCLFKAYDDFLSVRFDPNDYAIQLTLDF